MLDYINTPFKIADLTLPNRLIQGPLAGYSCAPFRALFHHFKAPAYAVSEMISAKDLVHKKNKSHRYVARAPQEKVLAYQIAGQDIDSLCKAAVYLEGLGADLIDLNCGCPKAKIRKKGAGSALLDSPQHLITLVKALREVLTIPLTVKVRIQGDHRDIELAQALEHAGADALIVHGRRWQDDYEVAVDYKILAKIKQALSIPMIANGDIRDSHSLKRAMTDSGCDAFMISRAGSGHPWLYDALLNDKDIRPSPQEIIPLFMEHLQGLAFLEDDYKALLQSKSLVRYYFKSHLSDAELKTFYAMSDLNSIEGELTRLFR